MARRTRARPNRAAGRRCNLGTNSIQANPNKTKQNRLDFLGFIWPIWGFSTGYEQKNKKICLRLNSPRGLCVSNSFSPFSRPSDLARAVRSAVEFGIAEDHSPDFSFAQQNVDEFANSLSWQPAPSAPPVALPSAPAVLGGAALTAHDPKRSLCQPPSSGADAHDRSLLERQSKCPRRADWLYSPLDW